MRRRPSAACAACSPWPYGITRKKQLLLARDRFGEKPLFYSFVDGTFLFASEIGPLARHPFIQRDIDPEALELYLQFQFIPAPWSIYCGIRKLEPAHLAILDEEGLRMRRYWQVDYNRKTNLNEGEALDALEEKIDRAVRMQMVADVPLGAALSGGVDSGLVTALMARHAGEPVRTFTISFEEQDKDESPYARAVAEHVGSDHHEFTVRGEVHSVLPDVVRHYGEPFGDTSAVPTFSLCEFASRSVKVMMTGDGGDEMLGGYHRYAMPGWRTALSPLLDRLRDPAGAGPLVHGKRQASAQAAVETPVPLCASGVPGLLYNQFFTHRARRNLLGERTTGVVGRFVAQRLEEAMAHSLYPTDRLSLPGLLHLSAGRPAGEDGYRSHAQLPGDTGASA